MRLLQRYILFELLKVFLFLLSLLTVLLVFVGVFREVAASGLGPFQILQILPFVVPILLPATLLLAVCVVYGRIAGDQEITAAKAAGINVFSLLWPAFLLSIVMSITSLVLTDQVIPWAISNIQRTVAMAVEDIFLDMLRTNHQVTDERQGFSITVMDVQDKTLIKPTFQYSRPGHSPVTVQAATATMEFDLEEHQVVVHLVRGHIDIPGRSKTWFEQEEQRYPLPQEVAQPKPRHISIQKIHRKMNGISQQLDVMQQRQEAEMAMALVLGDFQKLVQEDYTVYSYMRDFAQVDLNRLNTEIYSRFAMSLSCFFFVLIGGPFSILQGRRQFLTSFFMCFLPILVVYYPIALLMMSLCKNGQADPAYAMWSGNLVLAVAGVWVLNKVLRH
jgi:lipopolysaccharide export system permease protein